MRRKTLSKIRITAFCLAVISIVVFSVNAAGISSAKREYKAAVKTLENDEAEISQSIEKNNKEIEQNEKNLNNLKADISEKSSEADELNKKVSDLSNHTDGKVCYLTFDDGPSKYTPDILKVLKEHNAKATFFVTGVGTTKYMKDIVDSGNAIALHTYCHDYSKIYKSTTAYFDDLTKIHDLVQEQTGVDCRVIRFPGGSSNLVSKKYCVGIMTSLTQKVEENGYSYFDWNVDSTDASGNNVAVDKLVKSAVDGAKYNRINVLMHDTGAKGTTVEALPKIIDGLREKGYSFEVLTEDTTGFHHKVNN